MIIITITIIIHTIIITTVTQPVQCAVGKSTKYAKYARGSPKSFCGLWNCGPTRPQFKES